MRRTFSSCRTTCTSPRTSRRSLIAVPARSLLAAALTSGAAVCGTPTQVAQAAIAELEHLDRERWPAVGWIDASGDGEWGIALRCGQISETDPQQIRLFAGCGIVAGSIRRPSSPSRTPSSSPCGRVDLMIVRRTAKLDDRTNELAAVVLAGGSRDASAATSSRPIFMASACWNSGQRAARRGTPDHRRTGTEIRRPATFAREEPPGGESGRNDRGSAGGPVHRHGSHRRAPG